MEKNRNMGHLESFVPAFDRYESIVRRHAPERLFQQTVLMFAVKAFAQPLSLWLHQGIERNRVRTVGGGAKDDG